MAKKQNLKYSGQHVEEEHAHWSHAVLALVGLVVALVTIVTFYGLQTQPSEPTTTTPVQQKVSRSYTQVTFQGVTDNRLSFSDVGATLSYQLAESHRVFNTATLPYKPSNIKNIKPGEKIDLVVKDSLITFIYHK